MAKVKVHPRKKKVVTHRTKKASTSTHVVPESNQKWLTAAILIAVLFVLMCIMWAQQ